MKWAGHVAPHGVTTQKITTYIFIVLKTSNFSCSLKCLFLDITLLKCLWIIIFQICVHSCFC